ncbi:MAG TPA: LysM-like peptidoglycan-binding domain-containing protein, partial [Xanthomonadaceae bacterium]|nr:LysM-like peptidoglycan-binding domain-containing protein [Xanthomonadaceae bacterium]
MHTSDGQTESRSGRRARLAKLREAILHRKVLARAPAGFDGRWSRRHWAHASVFATLGALVAALVPGFSAPTTPSAPAHASIATFTLALPALPKSQRRAAHEKDWQVVTVQSGQTLGGLFDEFGIPASVLHKLLAQPGAKDALTRLRPGAELGFDMPVEGRLRAFRFDRDDTHRVELTLVGDEVREKVIERPLETRTAVISGEVGKSLFWSARRLGLSGKAINQLTDEIFKYDIDFNEDVVATDRFSVVVDQYWRDGELVGTGPVQAATFTVRGKLYSGFRFEHDGKTQYYTADGRPLKRGFIRMPIPYARITSGFSKARKHPVLG